MLLLKPRIGELETWEGPAALARDGIPSQLFESAACRARASCFVRCVHGVWRVWRGEIVHSEIVHRAHICHAYLQIHHATRTTIRSQRDQTRKTTRLFFCWPVAGPLHVVDLPAVNLVGYCHANEGPFPANVKVTSLLFVSVNRRAGKPGRVATMDRAIALFSLDYGSHGRHNAGRSPFCVALILPPFLIEFVCMQPRPSSFRRRCFSLVSPSTLDFRLVLHSVLRGTTQSIRVTGNRFDGAFWTRRKLYHSRSSVADFACNHWLLDFDRCILLSNP